MKVQIDVYTKDKSIVMEVFNAMGSTENFSISAYSDDVWCINGQMDHRSDAKLLDIISDYMDSGDIKDSAYDFDE